MSIVKKACVNLSTIQSLFVYVCMHGFAFVCGRTGHDDEAVKFIIQLPREYHENPRNIWHFNLNLRNFIKYKMQNVQSFGIIYVKSDYDTKCTSYNYIIASTCFEPSNYEFPSGTTCYLVWHYT